MGGKHTPGPPAKRLQRRKAKAAERADAEEASSPAALLRLVVSSPVAATAITGTPSASRFAVCLLLLLVNRSNYSIFSSPSLTPRILLLPMEGERSLWYTAALPPATPRRPPASCLLPKMQLVSSRDREVGLVLPTDFTPPPHRRAAQQIMHGRHRGQHMPRSPSTAYRLASPLLWFGRHTVRL